MSDSMDGDTLHDPEYEETGPKALHAMWTGWAIASGAASITCFFILYAIARSRTTSRNAFNVFLWFLIFPDFIFSLGCLFTCTVNAAAPGLGILHVDWMCTFQAVYAIFGFTASPWMNALLGREVYRLLYANKWALVYSPTSPVMQFVLISCVYTWSFFVALWTVTPGVPLSPSPYREMACIASAYDVPSTVFFWLVFVPSFLLIPLIYMVVITALAFCHGLLKRASQARSLALFYSRILVVFVAFWLPAVFLIYLLDDLSPWTVWAGGMLTHIQGVASALMCLSKPDIAQAVSWLCRSVTRPFCCRCSSVDRDTVRFGVKRNELALTQLSSGGYHTSNMSSSVQSCRGVGGSTGASATTGGKAEDAKTRAALLSSRRLASVRSSVRASERSVSALGIAEYAEADAAADAAEEAAAAAAPDAAGAPATVGTANTAAETAVHIPPPPASRAPLTDLPATESTACDSLAATSSGPPCSGSPADDASDVILILGDPAFQMKVTVR
mmetsp:Transcript_20335/g.39604  ORF Transcript_20335/g.39604 Transcript_20335/m.39604 type:complete len:502 (-) Transcript_20335:144-1649(-)